MGQQIGQQEHGVMSWQGLRWMLQVFRTARNLAPDGPCSSRSGAPRRMSQNRQNTIFARRLHSGLTDIKTAGISRPPQAAGFKREGPAARIELAQCALQIGMGCNAQQ
jgi:hypothetical protein